MEGSAVIGREVEWQMAAPDLAAVRRWLTEHARVGGLVIEPRPTQQLHDTYLDTEDWRIYRAGFALRMREGLHLAKGAQRKGSGAVRGKKEATLKAFKSAREDVADRIELSEQLRASTPTALMQLRGPVGSRVHAVTGRRPLHTLFEVRTRRQRFAVRKDGAELGEIALDETVITRPDGGSRTSTQRVEVEALGEEHEPLERLVKALRSQCALESADRSKYELGLSLGLAPPQPIVEPAAVEGGMPVAEAARASLRRLLAAWLAHEPAARLGDDPEALHALRVTARRMDAILSLFSGYLPHALSRAHPKLKTLLRSLGAVRDLDLQLAELASFRKALPEAEGAAFEPLVRYLQSHRARARASMLRALDAKATASWLESLEAAIAPAEGPEDALETVAPGLITDRFRKLRKVFRQLSDHATMEEYHKARRRAKKLRYAIEPVASVYGKPAAELLRTLRRLQDCLGAQHDAYVAMTRLAELASRTRVGLPPTTVFLMGRLAEHYRSSVTGQRKKIEKTWRKLSGPRWRELRAVMNEKHEGALSPPRAG